MEQTNRPIVIPANESHCAYLAQNLREVDKEEIWAAGGFKPADALQFSFEQSPQSYAVLDGKTERPIMMFGVGPRQTMVDNKKQIWMLATDEINDISIRFLKECGNYVSLLGEGSKVFNYVMEGNTKTLKWLHWLGFTILKPKPHGLIGKNFHYVEKDLSCVPSLQQH